MSFYWLNVGLAFGREHPHGSADNLNLYLRGATLRKPTERLTARVDIPDRPRDQFRADDRDERQHGHEDLSSEGYKDREDVQDARRRTVARILRDAADQIEDGHDEGPLLDPSHREVGTFHVTHHH